MTSHNDEMMPVASVYASALLALAQERGEEDRIAEELGQLAAMADSEPDMADFFASPAVDDAGRRELVEKLLRGKASDTLVDTLQVMHRKGRLGLVASVERAYHQMLEKLRGRIEVFVRSASPLTSAQQARLSDAVKKKTGHDADLIAEVDPELLGGLVVRIADRKLDASVREKLRQMTAAFRERGSRELQRIREYVVE